MLSPLRATTGDRSPTPLETSSTAHRLVTFQLLPSGTATRMSELLIIWDWTSGVTAWPGSVMAGSAMTRLHTAATFSPLPLALRPLSP